MRHSLIKVLKALSGVQHPITPKEIQELTGLSKSVTSGCCVELYDNGYVDRTHLGGRRGYQYELLPNGATILKLAEREGNHGDTMRRVQRT